MDAQPWVAVAFSHDMEHIAAATQQHAIYLYGLHSGALDKVLTINGAFHWPPPAAPPPHDPAISCKSFINPILWANVPCHVTCAAD